MITASHNPYTDNGVKIFAPGGLKLSDDVESQIEAQLEAELTARAVAVRAPEPGSSVDVGRSDATAEYVEHIVAMFSPDLLTGLRVVLDCANGAMSEAAPQAVRALGADAVSYTHLTLPTILRV